MTEAEKVKEAYRIATEALKQEFDINIVKGTTAGAIIGPMAAEIYRQMNRVVVITSPERASRVVVEHMAKDLATTLSARVIISQTGHELIVSDDDSIKIEVQPEDAEPDET